MTRDFDDWQDKNKSAYDRMLIAELATKIIEDLNKLKDWQKHTGGSILSRLKMVEEWKNEKGIGIGRLYENLANKIEELEQGLNSLTASCANYHTNTDITSLPLRHDDIHISNIWKAINRLENWHAEQINKELEDRTVNLSPGSHKLIEQSAWDQIKDTINHLYYDEDNRAARRKLKELVEEQDKK